MNDNTLTYEELLAERDQYKQFAEDFKKERDTANKNLKELARKIEEINPLKQKLVEVNEENYLRDRGMSNPDQRDYALFRIRQTRDREGVTFEEAADAYLEEHKHDPVIEIPSPTPSKSTLDILAERDYARRYEMGRRLFGNTKKANEK